MRVVMAPDCFGGTLSGVQAAAAMAAGWRAGAPHDTVVELPLSDGGPGFVDVVAAARPGGRLLSMTVEDPLARPTAAAVYLVDDTAWVESAQACGLHLLVEAERDPEITTTYGVGQMILAAVGAGATTVVVGLGGSGTNDGGAGALAALGAIRSDGDGNRLAPGGTALREAATVRLDLLDPRLAGVDLVLATDVDHRMLGLAGASATFGPQKGADAFAVQRLDIALTRWLDVLEESRPGAGKAAHAPGGGAAGGLAGGLMAIGARRVPGVDHVLDLVDLDAALDACDLVVTGEGRYDWTSLRGKVASGVAGRAQDRGLPCVVLCGQNEVGRREYAAHGVEEVHSVAELVGSVEESLRRPAAGLSGLAERTARQWSPSPR